MRIVIIGTGNTATVLGRLFCNKGHEIVAVIGRSRERTEQLAKVFNASFNVLGEQIDNDADIYIIAVSDNAIAEVGNMLQLGKKLVVHTAGSVEKEVLLNCSKNFGVMYPLQSLRKEMDQLPDIPFLIDGNTGDNCAVIADLAKTLSTHVELANNKQRLSTHLAAVMVSNFTNHLYVLAEEFCEKEHVSFSMLMPLIVEVADRLHRYSPRAMQTGPALRNDTATIEKHLLLLEHHPLQQPVYKFITESIIRMYG